MEAALPYVAFCKFLYTRIPSVSEMESGQGRWVSFILVFSEKSVTRTQ